MQFLTRLVDGHVCAYRRDGDDEGPLRPVARWRPCAGDEVVGHAADPSLGRAYYTTLHAVVCVAADGGQVWRSDFAPRSDERYGHRPGCALSADGRALWVYRPDAMAGRGRPDQWTVLDTGTGAALASADLGTVGHSGLQFLHPASGEVLLDVGEGQDGAAVHRASLADGRIDLVRYPWDDRCLLGLAPDGRHFMTVDHAQADIALHTYPDGEVEFTLPVAAFGHDPEAARVEWSGGYLDADTVIVTLVGESDGYGGSDGSGDEGDEGAEEWTRRYLVDTRTGRVRGAFDARTEELYDVRPLGDGSWLTTAPSGHPVRRSAR
ncbi:hypothetical protein RVR_598 [Actinacidiphila reveromycinica]|uniref:Uncharacterized protein n=1 Tax=Actinacidiphila reveromycinica TaxID=659352 RepID=A0A7U3VLL2_9ACTN|nr:hypothetical protein [Streptomyces sp. SN-593]BBA95653.1 hypothetical protein RVR_598 [Streptomyces sp. SN-593]